MAKKPNQTFIPQGNCDDPSKPHGWSVGWADQYDQTDAGQPIDLTGVPDGMYVLRAVVDPLHALTESNTANDVTDTRIQITGTGVTSVSQTNPTLTPPSVTLTPCRAHHELGGLAGVRGGNDPNHAVSPAPASGWVFLDQWLDTGTGNTPWSQHTNQTTGRAGTKVTVKAGAPATDQWNLAVVELVNSGD
ncbi:MAG: lysyl oxidase family protein [Actinomycetota bacterium]|nr:lysyl oxidase family protein [Actinomycetota bacterium]